MDKKSKIFFLVMGLLIVGSVAVSYYKYMVKRDYIIQAEAECDPYTETCFVYVCDPEAGEECTGDPVEDTSYYKLINRNAKNIPLCDPSDETCDALTCPEGEADCSFTLCDSTEEGAECNDPAVYTLENPIEETEEEGIEEESGEEEVTDESKGDVTSIVESDTSEEAVPVQAGTDVESGGQNNVTSEPITLQ
ncbi:MAG: hypothetical protein Q8Q10_03320 [bacterium]|nr:hypothetical protein [bacterium]